MGLGPEEEAARINFWGQDGQCQGSVLLSPTFQEGQVPMGPSPKDYGDLCEEKTGVCGPWGQGSRC